MFCCLPSHHTASHCTTLHHRTSPTSSNQSFYVQFKWLLMPHSILANAWHGINCMGKSCSNSALSSGLDVSGSTWEISDIWIQQYHWLPTDRFEMVSKRSFEEAQHDLRQKTNRPSTYIYIYSYAYIYIYQDLPRGYVLEPLSSVL